MSRFITRKVYHFLILMLLAGVDASASQMLTISLESPALNNSQPAGSETKERGGQSSSSYTKLGKVGIVIAARADIYRSKSAKSAKYYTAKQETPLAIVEEDGPWYGVLMSNGAIGWISKHLVRLTNYAVVTDKTWQTRTKLASRGGYASRDQALGESIVQTALRYSGVPYVFGGTDPSTGMDCSAFVQLVFAQYGIKLPRTAREQAQVGVSVPFDQLQPGDRLYFQCKNSYIDHCGIYVGNGYFVHCSASRNGVAVDSLTSDFYWRSLVVARR